MLFKALFFWTLTLGLAALEIISIIGIFHHSWNWAGVFALLTALSVRVTSYRLNNKR